MNLQFNKFIAICFDLMSLSFVIWPMRKYYTIRISANRYHFPFVDNDILYVITANREFRNYCDKFTCNAILFGHFDYEDNCN